MSRDISDIMEVFGITAKENEIQGNVKDCGAYSTILDYLVLDVEDVSEDTKCFVILKDVRFKPIYPSKKQKRAWLRNLIKQNHIKKVV